MPWKLNKIRRFARFFNLYKRVYLGQKTHARGLEQRRIASPPVGMAGSRAPLHDAGGERSRIAFVVNVALVL